MKCACCGKNEAAWEWPCILISHTETNLGDRLQMRQAVAGLDKAGLCPECEKEKSWGTSKSQIAAVFGIVISLFLLFAVFASRENMKISSTLAYAAIGVLFLASVFLLFFGKFRAQKHYEDQPMEKRARLLGFCKGEQFRYVPVGDNFYRSQSDFEKVNITLLSDLSRKVYNELIKTEKWKEMTPGKISVVDFASGDPLEMLKALRTQSMDSAVKTLRKICGEHPDGVDPSSPEAEMIRKCGTSLNFLGNTDMMRSAYEKIAGEGGELSPGFAECVNSLWKDIGDWGK